MSDRIRAVLAKFMVWVLRWFINVEKTFIFKKQNYPTTKLIV